MTVVTSAVTCPHCGASNRDGSTFCQSCGKALPSGVASGPRVIDGSGFATTAAGQKLQSDELQKQMKKSRGALLAVAIIQTIVCGVIAALLNGTGHSDQIFNNPYLLGLGGSAVVFWGLFFWARSQPLPAVIVGLVLYSTLVIINVVFSMKRMAEGGPGSGFGGIGVGWLDIVILVVLGKGISAGVKHRKLMQASAA